MVIFLVPRCKIDENVKSAFAKLLLADPEFYQPALIDILLGCEVYNFLLSNQSIVIKNPNWCGLTAISTGRSKRICILGSKPGPTTGEIIILLYL